MTALVGGQGTLFATVATRPTLRPYQERDLAKILACLQRGVKGILYALPTGGGKCLGRGTPVLMFDGTIKPVEDVRVGDQIMGPDSRPRTVQSVTSGMDRLYRVTPRKGDPYVVNEAHILSLKMTGGAKLGRYRKGDIVNLDVRSWHAASKTFRHCAKGWRTGVEFAAKPVPRELPAYFLGLWLADGRLGNGVELTDQHPRVVEYLRGFAESVGLKALPSAGDARATTWRLTRGGRAGGGRGRKDNPVLNALRGFGLMDERSIPDTYKVNSREVRLAVLAGIIDGDGHLTGHSGYDLILKDQRLADDIAFLARSLGFAAYRSTRTKTATNTGATADYHAVYITGDLEIIPVLKPERKAPPRRQKKDVLVVGLEIEPIGEGEYFGFEIDGDRLFLLGDFTVTHNTVCFSTVTGIVLDQGWEVWIFVHRRELLHQTSRTLLAMGISHGLIAPGQPLTNDPVQVVSIDTALARLEQLRGRLARVRLGIIDEAHHVVAAKWQTVIAAMTRALLLGVTATPFRYDGKGLGGFFKESIQGPSVGELIRDGYLAPPAIFAPPAKLDLSKVKKRGGDYVAGELARVVDTDELTLPAVRHYARICPGVPAIAFCAGVEHARHVAEQFSRAGWAAMAIDGEMRTEDRDRAIRALATGRLQVLTSCEIISEGTDIPIVGAAILLRPTKSTGLYLQQVGRVLRLYDGKTEAVIIDQVGNVAEHGMPDERRSWSLEGGLKGLERAVTATRRCRHCHFVCAQGPARCPRCNRAYPVPRAAGPSEVALGAMPGIRGFTADQIARMKFNALMSLAQTEEELRIVARIKGYKPGWVSHVLTERAIGTRRFG